MDRITVTYSSSLTKASISVEATGDGSLDSGMYQILTGHEAALSSTVMDGAKNVTDQFDISYQIVNVAGYANAASVYVVNNETKVKAGHIAGRFYVKAIATPKSGVTNYATSNTTVAFQVNNGAGNGTAQDEFSITDFAYAQSSSGLNSSDQKLDRTMKGFEFKFTEGEGVKYNNGDVVIMREFGNDKGRMAVLEDNTGKCTIEKIEITYSSDADAFVSTNAVTDEGGEGAFLPNTSGSDKTVTIALKRSFFVLAVESGAFSLKKVKFYYNSNNELTQTIPLATSMSFASPTFRTSINSITEGPELVSAPASLKVTYTSSNTGVATVDANTGVVTGKTAGTTTITATFAGNDYLNGPLTASYTLTVRDQALTVQTYPYTWNFTEPWGVTVDDIGNANWAMRSERPKYIVSTAAYDTEVAEDKDGNELEKTKGLYFTVYSPSGKNTENRLHFLPDSHIGTYTGYTSSTGYITIPQVTKGFYVIIGMKDHVDTYESTVHIDNVSKTNGGSVGTVASHDPSKGKGEKEVLEKDGNYKEYIYYVPVKSDVHISSSSTILIDSIAVIDPSKINAARTNIKKGDVVFNYGFERSDEVIVNLIDGNTYTNQLVVPVNATVVYKSVTPILGNNPATIDSETGLITFTRGHGQVDNTGTYTVTAEARFGNKLLGTYTYRITLIDGDRTAPLFKLLTNEYTIEEGMSAYVPLVTDITEKNAVVCQILEKEDRADGDPNDVYVQMVQDAAGAGVYGGRGTNRFKVTPRLAGDYVFTIYGKESGAHTAPDANSVENALKFTLHVLPKAFTQISYSEDDHSGDGQMTELDKYGQPVYKWDFTTLTEESLSAVIAEADNVPVSAYQTTKGESSYYDYNRMVSPRGALWVKPIKHNYLNEKNKTYTPEEVKEKWEQIYLTDVAGENPDEVVKQPVLQSYFVWLGITVKELADNKKLKGQSRDASTAFELKSTMRGHHSTLPAVEATKGLRFTDVTDTDDEVAYTYIKSQLTSFGIENKIRLYPQSANHGKGYLFLPKKNIATITVPNVKVGQRITFYVETQSGSAYDYNDTDEKNNRGLAVVANDAKYTVELTSGAPFSARDNHQEFTVQAINDGSETVDVMFECNSTGGGIRIFDITVNSIESIGKETPAVINIAEGKKYATFCWPHDIDLTSLHDKLGAYTASSPKWLDRTDDVVTIVMGRVKDDHIPANTGVLLKSFEGTDKAHSYDLSKLVQDDDTYDNSAYTGNLLHGVTVPTEVARTEPDSDCYNFILSTQDGLQAFYDIRHTGMLAAYRAYLSVPYTSIPEGTAKGDYDEVSQTALMLTFFDNYFETNGIEQVEDAVRDVQSATQPIYNLNGMKVSNPAKGIYIRNGKKVVIK